MEAGPSGPAFFLLPCLVSDHPRRVPRLQVAFGFGLGALGPAVELAAGEDHFVDLVGAVGYGKVNEGVEAFARLVERLAEEAERVERAG